MKNIYYLFFLCLSLVSCVEDDKESFNLILNQTSWSGELTLSNPEEIVYNINIVFETENSGEYYIDKFIPELAFSYKTTLKYKIDSEIILIEGGYNNILTGYWWVVSNDGKKLILKRNINSEQDCDTLNLIKLI